MRLTPTFLLSATSPAHFPTEAKTYNAPEIAFLGRSNVGKSSLINALLGSKQAHTSSTPGRTRAINFFGVYEQTVNKTATRPTMIFADLPGYGYAKISKSISAEWPLFIEPYIAERETLALGICLVDTNIPPQASGHHPDPLFPGHRPPLLSRRHQVRPHQLQRPAKVPLRPAQSPRNRRSPPSKRPHRSRHQSPLVPPARRSQHLPAPHRRVALRLESARPGVLKK